jgi:hypothetical protein
MCSLFLVGAVKAHCICRLGIEPRPFENQFKPLIGRGVPVEGLGVTVLACEVDFEPYLNPQLAKLPEVFGI